MSTVFSGEKTLLNLLYIGLKINTKNHDFYYFSSLDMMYLYSIILWYNHELFPIH